jgi:heme oxygenase (biliverdin-IX-beta and delta-forming)
LEEASEVVHPIESMQMQMTTLTSELRQGTRAEHEALEGSMDMGRALESRESYAELLANFYGMVAPLERRLREFPEVRQIMEGRWRTELLREDLAALGLSADKLMEAKALPRLRTADEAAGAAYVLEGSTLGGQIITRMVQERLGEVPTRYFAGHGSETGSKWKQFVAELNAMAVEPNACVKAAQETFRGFREWFGSANH